MLASRPRGFWDFGLKRVGSGDAPDEVSSDLPFTVLVCLNAWCLRTTCVLIVLESAGLELPLYRRREALLQEDYPPASDSTM